MTTSIPRAIRGLSLGIWLGAGIMTFITASYVFGGLPRATAGDIMGPILHTGGLLKLGLAALAIVSEFLLRKSFTPPSRKSNIGLYTLLFATALALFVAIYLEPKMLDLRAKYMSYPNPDGDSPERTLFKQLHGGSMGIALLELVLIAVALVCAVV